MQDFLLSTSLNFVDNKLSFGGNFLKDLWNVMQDNIVVTIVMLCFYFIYKIAEKKEQLLFISIDVLQRDFFYICSELFWLFSLLI